jgi:(R,R)-butanediol dehydrogenase / meso-butanediol dehydrogenase / diacetyl reductase
MLAARWHGRGDIRVECVPEPAPAPHELLIAIEWAGICGTDLEELRDGPIAIPVDAPHPLSGRQAPITLGHETVGTVVRSAADGSGPPIGTRVVPNTMISCGRCYWCVRHDLGLCEQLGIRGLSADGGLAELMVADAASCTIVPPDVAADVAALAEPTSVAVRAVRKVPISLGTRALVIGAGTIGLLVVQVLRAAGATGIAVLEPNQARRALALELGADEAADDVPPSARYDAVLECAGAPGLQGLAVRLTRRAGTTVLVGFHKQPEVVDIADAVLGEKRIVGSAGIRWDEDVADAVFLLARGRVRVERLVTHRVSLQRLVEDGLAALADRDSGAIKVLVTPSSSGQTYPETAGEEHTNGVAT